MSDAPKRIPLVAILSYRAKWLRWFLFDGPLVGDPQYRLLFDRWLAREPKDHEAPHLPQGQRER